MANIFFLLFYYISRVQIYIHLKDILCNLYALKYYHLLTLKGRCILQTKGRDNWGGLWPPQLSRLLVMGRSLFFQGTNIL